MILLYFLFFWGNFHLVDRGVASVHWPGDGMSGNFRADGKFFTNEQCHIAHRTIPLNSIVKVCSIKTKKCIVTAVMDRGPFGSCSKKLSNGYKCEGKWKIKLKRKSPGTWRGIADLSYCVWKYIGGPQMQIVSIYKLQPNDLQKQLIPSFLNAVEYGFNLDIPLRLQYQ